MMFRKTVRDDGGRALPHLNYTECPQASAKLAWPDASTIVDVSCGPSRQHVLNHLPVYVGQAAVDAVVIEHQPRVVDAQQVQDRAVEVVDRDDVLYGLVAQLVGGAVA